MATPMPLPAGGGEIRNSRSHSFLASIAYSAAEISSLRVVGEYRGEQPLCARQVRVFESQIGVARTESPSTP